MSFQLPTERTHEEVAPSWSNAAFLVESMLLLVFLIASLAVFTQMFSASVTHAENSRQLTAAVTAASDTAERFAANPSQVSAIEENGGLIVACNISSEDRLSGTLYHATISVYAPNSFDRSAGQPTGDPVYSVSTARFESEVG